MAKATKEKVVKSPKGKVEKKEAKPKKAAPTKEKKEKKVKDPNAPKKPSGAYIFFCNDKRPQLKKDNPSWGIGEFGKELGSMWKEVDEAGKKKYVAMAEKDKERYQKELAAYEKK